MKRLRAAVSSVNGGSGGRLMDRLQFEVPTQNGIGDIAS